MTYFHSQSIKGSKKGKRRRKLFQENKKFRAFRCGELSVFQIRDYLM